MQVLQLTPTLAQYAWKRPRTLVVRDHPFSMYTRFFEKQTFHKRVRIRGSEMLVSWKILRTY